MRKGDEIPVFPILSVSPTFRRAGSDYIGGNWNSLFFGFTRVGSEPLGILKSLDAPLLLGNESILSLRESSDESLASIGELYSFCIQSIC
jgi:hypothetical protein